jgi:hypothetical protein
MNEPGVAGLDFAGLALFLTGYPVRCWGFFRHEGLKAAKFETTQVNTLGTHMEPPPAGYSVSMVILVVVVPLLLILAVLGMERLEARLMSSRYPAKRVR